MTFNSRTPGSHTRAARPALAALALTACALLAGCGGSDSTAAVGKATPSAQAGGGTPTDRVGGPMSRGTSGLVADVSGSTAQVQTTSDGQVAVTWNKSTSFTSQVAASLDAVTVGSCVMVTPAESSSETTSATVYAGSVRVIAAAADGSCSMGFAGGRGPGTPPSGAPSGMPSGFPSDMPSDMPPMPDGERPTGAPSGRPDGARGGFGGFGTFGTVTAVSSNGFTVESAMPSMPGSDEETAAAPISVSVSAATTYTATKKASATAVKVGVCVMATGEADDTGAVTATSVAVTPAVDGACAAGFGARPNGRGGATSGNVS